MPMSSPKHVPPLFVKAHNAGDLKGVDTLADALETSVNFKTAKALNLTIPASLLLRADQVIDP